MASARIELTAGDDDDSRRRKQRRGMHALIVLGGLVALALAGPKPPDKPALHLSPGIADFGSHEVGSESTAVVTLSNATKAPFVLAGIVAEGADTRNDFRIDATKCRRIDAGANCSATVLFTPRADGPQSANFRVIDAANAASETIVVRGMGTKSVPPPIVAPPIVAPPIVAPSEPQTPAPVEPPPTPTPTPAPKPNVTPKPRPQPQPAPISSVPTTVPTATEPPPESPAPTETTPTTETTAPTEPSAPPQQATTTTAAPERDHTKDTLKKLGRIALGIGLGAVIAHNAGGHDHGSNPRQPTDRRIDVQQIRNTVTVTNVGKDDVTITSVTISGYGTPENNCRTLSAGQRCSIWLPKVDQGRDMQGVVTQRTPGGATLIIDSNAGRRTLALR